MMGVATASLNCLSSSWVSGEARDPTIIDVNGGNWWQMVWQL
jgi:hypothetical protein